MTRGADDSAACADDAAGLDELLALRTLDVNRRVGPREETALHAACRSGDVVCCKTLLAARADPSIRCVHGGTCLHQAAQFLNDGALVAMLQSSEETVATLVNVQDKNGWTALHATVYRPERSGPTPRSRVRIVQELLRAGAGIDIQNSAGQTPLELAIASGCQDGADAMRVAS